MSLTLFNKYPKFKDSFDVNLFAKGIQSLLTLKHDTSLSHIDNVQRLMLTIQGELESNNLKLELEKIDWRTKISQYQPHNDILDDTGCSDGSSSYHLNHYLKCYKFSHV